MGRLSKSVSFIIIAVMGVFYAGCGKDEKITIIKRDVQIIITERFQTYETLGYYVAKNVTGQRQSLSLAVEVRDFVTGETIDKPEITWHLYRGGAEVGTFYSFPPETHFASYVPCLDSPPQDVSAYVRYEGSVKYNRYSKLFDIKQNY